MTKENNTIKLSVTVDLQLNEKIEFWANKLGMTKSKFLAHLIAQQIDNYGFSQEILNNPEYIQAMVNFVQTNPAMVTDMLGQSVVDGSIEAMNKKDELNEYLGKK